MLYRTAAAGRFIVGNVANTKGQAIVHVSEHLCDADKLFGHGLKVLFEQQGMVDMKCTPRLRRGGELCG